MEGLEVVFAQLEGRLSLPLLNPQLIGVTYSTTYIGIALNLLDGKGMIYKTKSSGGQAGIYIGGGLEFGTFPTGTIDNMKGYSLNVGGSMAMTLLAGFPVGPEGGLELNLAIPTDGEGEINKEEFYQIGKYRLGATVAEPHFGAGAGATIYVDVSHTEAISEFDISERKYYITEFYNNYFTENEKEKTSYEQFYEEFMEKYIEGMEKYQNNDDN